MTIETTTTFTPSFNADGLLPAIAVDAGSGAVLMFAWMNADALYRTLDTGYAHFWSRSRQTLWRKGESSGNGLRVVEVRTDCDQDTLLMKVTVEGDGVACHTGANTCFYRRVEAAADGSRALIAD